MTTWWNPKQTVSENGMKSGTGVSFQISNCFNWEAGCKTSKHWASSECYYCVLLWLRRQVTTLLLGYVQISG